MSPPCEEGSAAPSLLRALDEPDDAAPAALSLARRAFWRRALPALSQVEPTAERAPADPLLALSLMEAAADSAAADPPDQLHGRQYHHRPRCIDRRDACFDPLNKKSIL